jgi:NAD(P)-dependent dehydrogenase (short-subunit alcohol dehydrogenase family)
MTTQKRKAIVVGASGRIGREIVTALQPTYDVIRVGLRSGDLQADYTDEASVRALFEATGPFDALVAAAGGDGVFKSYAELTDEDYIYGYARKVLGQQRLVRLGSDVANDGASFTLSSGFLSHYPNPASVAIGPLNAAINAFARSVAPLMPRGQRINVVSPAPIVEPGREGRGLITAAQAAVVYAETVNADFTGRTVRAWAGLPADVVNT